MSADVTASESSSDQPAHRYSAALAQDIELRWQDRWDDEGTFETPNPVGPLADPDLVAQRGEKLFVQDMFPYPSGSGLHVGHPLGFIGTDVYSRFKRMTGHNVLYTMGFDAFGLPAEQYAVQTGTHPAITTNQNIATYRRQLRRLGMSHDTRRSISTTDPSYYRWTQWIFSQIFNSWFDPDAPNATGTLGRARPIGELIEQFESGERTTPGGASWADLSPADREQVLAEYRLAYVSDAPVNWCPGLGTVVANEEVTADGRSDRGNFPVFKRNMRQWMMRITAYSDRLIDDLDLLDWTDAIKTMQRNWIGRSHGARVDFASRRRPDHGVHHASRHVVRRVVHGARSRAPLRRHAHHRRPGRCRRRLPTRGRVEEGRRSARREPREDRCVHRLVRHQPGQRRADPGVDRRLRPHGLRHRGHHGGSVRRRTRLRVRQRVRPADPRNPAAARRLVRGARHRAGPRHLDVADGVRRRRALRQLGQRLARPQRHREQSRRHRRHERLARAAGRRRGDHQLQAARLVVQPPALLG